MYESLRQNVNGNLASLPDHKLAEALADRNIDAEAMEGFFDDLGKFAARAAPAVLPIAGQVIGGIYGGPAGAAIGGQLGSLAGGAISSATSQRPAAPPRPVPRAPAVPQAAPVAAPPAAAPAPIPAGGGSPAAGQLLQTITRPEVLQALGSMAMGSSGRSEVPVNGTDVPVSAFSNLISVLAGQAGSEYGESMARFHSGVPEYMRGESGEALGDPAVEEDRARALYELLSEQESESESEAEWAEYESESESEADLAELLELDYELYESEAE
jgi:hypothetical protein